MSLIFIYITNPTKKDARKVAKRLLEKKLAACANIFPIQSLYKWQGRFVDEKEFVIIAKTAQQLFGKVKREVEKIHPYKIPCIAGISVEANKKFLKWVKDETKV